MLRFTIHLLYHTITWGAAISTAVDSSTVKSVKTKRQTLSSTIAANFHSFSNTPDSAWKESKSSLNILELSF